MKGRKPTPNAILKSRNSKAVRDDEPEYTAPLLEPPPHIMGRALDVWNFCASELDAAGVGCALDTHVLAEYCMAVAQAEAAASIIEREGLIAVTERGLTKHPATTIQNSAVNRIKQLASELGFTPASRGRVKIERSKPEVNEFEEV